VLALGLTGRIWVCLQPQDGRKGIDGLAAVVTTHLDRDPLGGDLFVFRNGRGDRLKILAWQGDGFALYLRRLERGTFAFPSADTTDLSITVTELAMILVLRTKGRRALEYGARQGDQGLREWLATDYSRKGATSVTPDNIVLTPGASGALASVCDVCLDPGDVVLLERPTFSGSIRSLVASEAELVGAAMDSEGIDPGEFERTVIRLRRAGKLVKILYTVPNFNNPTGALLPLARRERIAATCRAAGILVVQDDAFADLSLGPDIPPSFWSIMGGQGVVVVGTFSKSERESAPLERHSVPQPIRVAPDPGRRTGSRIRHLRPGQQLVEGEKTKPPVFQDLCSFFGKIEQQVFSASRSRSTGISLPGSPNGTWLPCENAARAPYRQGRYTSGGGDP
jgi:transposase